MVVAAWKAGADRRLTVHQADDFAQRHGLRVSYKVIAARNTAAASKYPLISEYDKYLLQVFYRDIASLCNCLDLCGMSRVMRTALNSQKQQSLGCIFAPR